MKSFPNHLIHSYSCLFYFGFPSNLATGSMRKNTEEEFFSLPTLTIFSNPGFHVRLGTPDDNWVSELLCSAMPVDNRRIAGPEVTQPVIFTGRKAFDKPLVRKE